MLQSRAQRKLEPAGEQERRCEPLPAWATWRLRPRIGRWLCSTCCSMFMATSLQICEVGLLERWLKVLQSKCAHIVLR
jgi:hypothetical protein